MGIEGIPRTLWWGTDENSGLPAVFMIDQSRLPLSGDVLVCVTHEGVCMAISGMAVRGAPALGVAAAMAIALWAANESDELTDPAEFLEQLDSVANTITSTRPTAVNLFWGAERMRALARANSDKPIAGLRELLVTEAQKMAEEDEARNREIGRYGAELLPDEARVLTHCNAGSLATAYFGTALGVIFTAHEQGKIGGVWVDETRPVLQGSRLTAWELRMAGIPFRLITDNMAASVMKNGWVDAIIVGADRIAANGDVANKIGTYGVAVLAKEHGIPFYVAAPTSTVDLQNRYRPDSTYLKRACDNGDLGEVYYARAHAIRRRAVPTWGVFLNEEEQGGGPLIDIGTHALDLTLWMMNNYEPVSVTGSVFRKLADQKEQGNAFGEWDPEEFTVEDSAFGFIKMKDGSTIHLEASWALNTLDVDEAKTSLCGTKAGADMKDGLRINRVQYNRQCVEKPDLGAGGVAFFQGGSEAAPDVEQRVFYDAVMNGKELVVKPEQAIVVTRILEAIYESARTGKTVYFD
jgi:S-methyl-5-thioribose-1-phosphate isomerase